MASLPDPRPLALEVRAREQVTPLVTRVVVGGDDLIGLDWAPGQDLMLAIPSTGDTINRRYTIRRSDPTAGTVDLDFVVHGHGPGSAWATDAPIGSTVSAVGPRGKVVPVADVAFHLFVCDESGWPATAAMVEALAPSTSAIVVADVAGPDEHQMLDAACDLRSVWCDRNGRPPGDGDTVLAALAELDLPPGRGHAYLSAEFAVVRALGAHLAGRGFASEQVSPKAYWRRDQANAAHGEPLRDAS